MQSQNAVRIADLPLEFLRLHLAGERPKMAQLYELLLNHTLRVEFRSLDGPNTIAPVVCDTARSAAACGFQHQRRVATLFPADLHRLSHAQ